VYSNESSRVGSGKASPNKGASTPPAAPGDDGGPPEAALARHTSMVGAAAAPAGDMLDAEALTQHLLKLQGHQVDEPPAGSPGDRSVLSDAPLSAHDSLDMGEGGAEALADVAAGGGAAAKGGAGSGAPTEEGRHDSSAPADEAADEAETAAAEHGAAPAEAATGGDGREGEGAEGPGADACAEKGGEGRGEILRDSAGAADEKAEAAQSAGEVTGGAVSEGAESGAARLGEPAAPAAPADGAAAADGAAGKAADVGASSEAKAAKGAGGGRQVVWELEPPSAGCPSLQTPSLTSYLPDKEREELFSGMARALLEYVEFWPLARRAPKPVEREEGGTRGRPGARGRGGARGAPRGGEKERGREQTAQKGKVQPREEKSAQDYHYVLRRWLDAKWAAGRTFRNVYHVAIAMEEVLPPAGVLSL